MGGIIVIEKGITNSDEQHKAMAWWHICTSGLICMINYELDIYHCDGIVNWCIKKLNNYASQQKQTMRSRN